MKILGLLCLLAVGYASASSIRKVIGNAESSSRLPSEYLVTVKPDLVRSTLKQGIDRFVTRMSNQISIVARYDFTKLSVLHIKSDSEAVAVQMYDFPEVSSVEANLYEKAIDEEPVCERQFAVNGLWGLARITKRDDDSDVMFPFQSDDGAGGFAYVVDTGIRTSHNDFEGRAIHGFIADDIEEGPEDLDGHGTHCAGTIMGASYGVAKAASVISVKTLNGDGFGSAAGTISGLNWIAGDFAARDTAAGGNLPAVVSMSLSFNVNTAMEDVLQELWDAGLITSAAAGNQNNRACYRTPARSSAAVTAMASDIDDRLATFSNYGDCANIIAPGVNVLSAAQANDNASAMMSGTSMACPHVSGVLLRRMTQVIKATGRRPSPAELLAWIEDNATRDAIHTWGKPDTKSDFLYSPCDVSN